MVLQIDMVERESERLERFVTLVLFQLAFPDGDAVLSHLCELLLLFSVPLLVASDLLCPIFYVRLRDSIEFASLMAMPKAAIDKDAGAVLAEHEVGMPW